MNKSKFCIGISKPLDILNSDIRNLIQFTINSNLYVHTSISYPINFIFINKLLKQEIRDKINFICKILGDNLTNFNKTVELTLKEYSLKKIHTLQLVCLPTYTKDDRNLENIDFIELDKIKYSINNLKQRKIINEVYLQIYSSDKLEFCKKMIQYFDGFAFYGNINRIQLDKNVYDFLLSKNISLINLSIFGNPKPYEKKEKNLHLKSFKFSQSYFTSNTIAVGRTLNLTRLKDLYNYKDQVKKLEIEFNPEFLQSIESQDNADNFYRRYKVTNKSYLIIFLLKCLIKKIIPSRLIKTLKK